MIQRWCLLAALAGGLACLAGCESKFTRERFDMIAEGFDDRDDVREHIGEPEFKPSPEEWYYENQKKHYSARIFFDETGRVKSKQWMDARTGTWEGQNPDTDPPPKGETREVHTKTRRIDDD